MRRWFVSWSDDLPVILDFINSLLELLAQIPSNSIHLVITSPPYYQQRDYGGGARDIGNEKNLDDYLKRLMLVMRECVRVIHSEGSIVFNLGDKYDESSLLLVPYQFALEATRLYPIKLVNAITWVKQNPTPRQFKRRLVSSTEPFFHFVKSDNYYYDIDAFMAQDRPTKSPQKPSAKLGQRYFELIAKSELTDTQKQQARRELMQVIQEVQTGKLEGFRMKLRGIHSEPFGGQVGGRQIQLEKNGFTIIRIYGNPLKKDVIETPVESVKGSNHPAMYPVNLIQEFLYLLTRKGDLVLDPFMGAGSTAVACKLTERHYIGFDLNPEYCWFAEERLKSLVMKPPLLF